MAGERPAAVTAARIAASVAALSGSCIGGGGTLDGWGGAGRDDTGSTGTEMTLVLLVNIHHQLQEDAESMVALTLCYHWVSAAWCGQLKMTIRVYMDTSELAACS